MKFAIKTAQQHCTWEEMLEIWRAADTLEVFESAWNFDHFYPLVGDTAGPCMEAWVTLSALAAVTSRIRIGCMVHGVPYRHPALTANMAATLDIVSGGRLDLGLGAGWHEEECGAYGIELLPMKQRMDCFEEAMEVVIRLLRDRTTTFEGEHFRLRDALCEPKGPQKPYPPIVIGGGGERRTLRIAARFADHWNLATAEPEQFQHKRSVLHRHCEALGRDPKDIRCSVQVALPADAEPSKSVEQAEALGAAGVDVVIFSMRPPYRIALVEQLAERLRDV